jgi:hypothetical protein
MTTRYGYRPAHSIGAAAASDDNHINPMTYCISPNTDRQFTYGSHAKNLGEDSRQCQSYLADYCSQRWDVFCEAASQNTKPTFIQDNGFNITELTGGELLIRNTASNKYLVTMVNAHKQYEPFDYTVASSPMISFWVQDDFHKKMIPIYEIDPNNIQTLDADPVMNRLLAKPKIGLDILDGIRKTMKKKNTLSQLRGTRLGEFYSTNPYFSSLGGLN